MTPTPQSVAHDTLVQNQFGPRAAAYVSSAVHASGKDLAAIAQIAARHAPAHALDLGTGGGHVAYALAPHATRVTASDLSPAMLEVVEATAAQRGLTNIETQAAPAENLPFADASFDLLACRFSAHHWQDFVGGLRQARRVLKQGAPAVFVDVVSPGPAAFDTHLQTVELLRDPSHVRDYTVAQWLEALGQAGFTVQTMQTRRLRMDYASWVERMQTPEVHRAAIRALQQIAGAETIRHFEIEADGSFMLDTAQIEAIAA